MSFMTFMANVPVGILAILRRIVMTILFGVIRLGRLDLVVIMRGFEQLDIG
jgi:Retinol binding protein receptor